jgi:hypothetical protein
MIADQQPGWEQVAERMQQEAQQLWESLDRMESGEALEKAVQVWQRAMGRQVMQALCQEAIRRRDQAQVPMCCDRRMDNHSRPWRTVKTLQGDVRVRRRWYRCLQCGANRFPVDQWLGWKGGFSHGVQEVVAWECAGLPYREAVASLEKLGGLAVSVHAAERIVARWGEAELTPAPYQERVDKDLVIQIDGTTTHLEEGWKEIKVGAFFSCDCADKEATPQAISYIADWRTAHDFRGLLDQEALVRGAPAARRQAVIGDGAPWVWDTASWLFPQAVQILDWYHLTQHLWAAGKAVHGEGAPHTRRLVEGWKTQVWEGCSEAVEEHMRELVKQSRDDRDQTLRKCADYLRTHQHRLRYHLFRAAGWPVASGVVEGACKHVVGLRFKRQSTRWTRAGARAVLHLRLDRLNHRWEERSNHMRTPLRKAA